MLSLSKYVYTSLSSWLKQSYYLLGRGMKTLLRNPTAGVTVVSHCTQYTHHLLLSMQLICNNKVEHPVLFFIICNLSWRCFMNTLCYIFIIVGAKYPTGAVHWACILPSEWWRKCLNWQVNVNVFCVLYSGLFSKYSYRLNRVSIFS